MKLYASLPLRDLSRLWGTLHSYTVPTFLRSPLYKTYGYLFNCNLDEMKEPSLSAYKNLGEFFYRELKDGIRPVDPSALMVNLTHTSHFFLS
jgi:phosphatidylserine decarboxylase